METTIIGEVKMVELLNKHSETGMHVVFDIETAPLPDDLLARVYDDSKLVLPERPAPFKADEAVPKNWKDPVKIKARLLEKQAEYMKEVEQHPDRVAAVKDEAWGKFKEKAALEALTGWVCAIGYSFVPVNATAKKAKRSLYIQTAMEQGREHTVLDNFWEIAGHLAVRSMVGHNIKEFDMPFLTQRSWLNSMRKNPFDARGFLDSVYRDTMIVWNCGRRGKYTKLDTICRAMNVKGKTEGLTGDQFYPLLLSDPEKADEYLEDDVMATERIAGLMGLFN